MRTSLVQVRVEDHVKNRASEIFDDLGMDLSTAIRIFLKKSVLENGIPFDLRLPKKEKQIQKALDTLESISAQATIDGISEMSLDEINAEIAAARLESQGKK